MDTEDELSESMNAAWHGRRQRHRMMHPDPRDPDYEEPPDEENPAPQDE